jgi:hypothetical protein
MTVKYSNAEYVGGSYQAAAKGMWPKQDEVHAGTYLYRFVDLNRATARGAADGPWWFEYEYYQTIKHFAIRHGYSLGYAARLFAAILYEWSEVNAVIRAKVVKGPLMAWKGKGKQVEAVGSDARDVSSPHGVLTEQRGTDGQTPHSRKMTPTQGPLEVLQLYIPGLGRPYFRFASLMEMDDPIPIDSHSPTHS